MTSKGVTLPAVPSREKSLAIQFGHRIQFSDEFEFVYSMQSVAVLDIAEQPVARTTWTLFFDAFVRYTPAGRQRS